MRGEMKNIKNRTLEFQKDKENECNRQTVD